LQTPSAFGDEVWTTLTGVRPSLGELEAALGEALLADGDTLGALSELKRAHARDPKNVDACKLLAEAHVKNNQLGAALAVLDSLVINLRNAGKLEAMVETLRKMAALAPDNIRVKSRLIDSYLQRGFVEEAKTELLARANLEERSGRISDAVLSLQRSADLSWSLGRHEESFATYQRLIALAPDDAGARSSLVNLYLQLGRIGDAAEHQRAVVDIATRTGSPHEAIAALHQVIGLTPDDASAYFQLGELLQSMGEHQQAEKVYKRLVLMNPNDHLALEKLAQVIALKQIDASKLTVPAI
jgi:tetratricopeptide (TPR) repeat protein